MWNYFPLDQMRGEGGNEKERHNRLVLPGCFSVRKRWTCTFFFSFWIYNPFGSFNPFSYWSFGFIESTILHYECILVFWFYSWGTVYVLTQKQNVCGDCMFRTLLRWLYISFISFFFFCRQPPTSWCRVCMCVCMLSTSQWVERILESTIHPG